MSTLVISQARAVVVAHRHVAKRNELGQSTSEYGVAILCAVALGLAVLEIVTGGALNGVLGTMLKHILTTATGMVH